jgi:hypothetical protein
MPRDRLHLLRSREPLVIDAVIAAVEGTKGLSGN